MQLNYKELTDEIIQQLDNTKWMVLASSADDKVTARMMSIVNDGLKIYFQTDKNFEKYEQIKKNPNIALCIDNIQIEGVAKELGHPMNEENKLFSNKFKEKHPNSFKNYSHLEAETLFVVEANKFTMWKYIEKIPYRDYLYCTEKLARREEYVGE